MKRFSLGFIFTFVFVVAWVSFTTAQVVSFSFTANHTCEYRQLDSVLIQNVTQDVDTVIYFPDTVLTYGFTVIDDITDVNNAFFVSQNYPNPFEFKTNIDVYVPEKDIFTINVYNTTGSKLSTFRSSLQEGLHNFRFMGGNDKSYILTVNSNKYLEHILMIQFGSSRGSSPRIQYLGQSTKEEQEYFIFTKSLLRASFSYNLGDMLSFTGFVTDAFGSVDYDIITDNPIESQLYVFDINNVVPEQPSEIFGNEFVCPNESDINFHVTDIQGVSFNWSVPESWEIDAGQGTESINVTSSEQGGEIIVSAENACGTSPNTSLNIDIYELSVEAESITGNFEICPGQNTTLSVEGGALGAEADWHWYADACGENLINTGANINVSPNETTTYFVRAVGACNTTTCVEATVHLKTQSVVATSIGGDSPVCQGIPSELYVIGGELGTGAEWNWFTGSCGGTLIATGDTITITPTANTVYFVRAIGDCNTTNCRLKSVSVETASFPADNITGNLEICEGESTQLSFEGGTLGQGAQWFWYENECGGNFISNETTIDVSPSETTTYFLRGEGACNETECVQATVVVNQNSEPASLITGELETCPDVPSELSVEGGALGTGADWQWYKDECGTNLVGTGETVTILFTETSNVFVRAEGDCNITDCIDTEVALQTESETPSGINGPEHICQGELAQLTVEGGQLGTAAEWHWYEDACGENLIGSGNSISINPSETTTYFVRAEGVCNTTECAEFTLIVKEFSTAADFISGSNEICIGEDVELSFEGGELGTGAEWKWYEGSCGGTLVYTGTNPVFSPTTTTDYFLRAEGDCNTTACIEFNVYVKTESSQANQILGNDFICPAENTTLSVDGGTLGSGAEWEWYSGACGFNHIGSGHEISVNPDTPETYFVRAEGDCNVTECNEITINIKDLSAPPTEISEGSIICPGEDVNLNISGGSLGTGAQWVWYTLSCGGEEFGQTGDNIIVSPIETTTYFVRAEGDCNATICLEVEVTLKEESSEPVKIMGDNYICPASNTELSVDGGSLGTGASWEWFSGSCGGTHIGSGSSITVQPDSQTTYFVRAEGDCNTTECSELTVSIKTLSVTPSSITGLLEICPGEDAELNVEGGQLGSGASWHWYADGCGTIPVGTGETLFVSPLESSSYFVRAEGDCNISDCIQEEVFVKTLSVAAEDVVGDSEICLGNDANLSVVGGSLGTGANWEWHIAGCLGGHAGSGENITVSPIENTMYYVSAQGDCNTTECFTFTVVVNDVPEAPSEIMVDPDIFEVEWDWTEVPNADGYKYNTVNDFSTATDHGAETYLMQTEIDCEVTHSLFVWAYNECGPSDVLEMSATTGECPWLCGDDIEYEGYFYATVEIGGQCWFAENLRYLPAVSNSGQGSENLPHYYVYDYEGNDVGEAEATQNYIDYGVLYNFPAATNVCPEGWRLPSDDDWKVLEMELGMTQAQADDNFWRGTDQGPRMAGNADLWNPAAITSNEYFGSSGLDLIPGGTRQLGSYNNIGDGADYWTSTASGGFRIQRRLFNLLITVWRDQANPAFGMSVRCLQDE